MRMWKGHEETKTRLNVRNELRRLRRDPLVGFLRKAYPKLSPSDSRARYEDAFSLYVLSMQRGLEQVSTVVRFMRGPYYVLKYGGNYGPGQRKLADKYWKLRPFLELDVATALLQARILLDRTVGLSRSFLRAERLPSFSSFSDHKKFFTNGGVVAGHEAYGVYMCRETDWFDVPIKFVRDKLIVHNGPRHMKGFTLPFTSTEGDDLVQTFCLLPEDRVPTGARTPMQAIRVSIRRLLSDMETFLLWFGAYAKQAVMATKPANKRLNLAAGRRRRPTAG